MGAGKASEPLLEHLAATLKKDAEARADLVRRIKAVVVFKIDGDEWTLDLREGKGALARGPPAEGQAPALTLTATDANFCGLVLGTLNPQTAFVMRKLKIEGSMALAMKLQPILDAAKPAAKL